MGILKGRNGREAMEIEELPFPAMDLRPVCLSPG